MNQNIIKNIKEAFSIGEVAQEETMRSFCASLRSRNDCKILLGACLGLFPIPVILVCYTRLTSRSICLIELQSASSLNYCHPIVF